MKLGWAQEALCDAYPHVLRQLDGGRHEQDREDAEEWLRRYGKAVRKLRAKRGMKDDDGK